MTPDIYTFQESHSTQDSERFWNAALPGKVAYSHGTNHARGVLLGVHPNSRVSLVSTIQDEAGRYVIAECAVDEEWFVVVSVYLEPLLGPDQYNQILCEIAHKVEVFNHTRILWIGDFNVALDPDLDTTAITHKRDIHSRE